MKTKELIAQIVDLPVNERAKAVSQILRSFNRPDPEIEKAWAKEARRRLEEFKAGKVEAIPGEQVMKELKEITGE